MAFNLTSHKYFKCLMVAVYKLNSESNAETVYLCQNVIFASSLRSLSVKCSQSKGEGSCLHEYMLPSFLYLKWKVTELFALKKAFRGKSTHFFLRCLT